MTASRQSIAFRLIAAVLLVELLFAVLVIALSWGYERHAHFRAFDVMLRGRADSVIGAVQDAEDAGDNVMLDKADLRHLPAEDIYAVWNGNGHLLGNSANWPAAATPPPQDGFSRMLVGKRHYRVLRERGSRIVDPGDPGGGILRQVTVVYGAPTEHVWHAIFGAVEFYAAGSLLLLIVTGPLIAWLLHRGLLPLRQLAALAGRVTADDLQFAPPASAVATRELAPLTHALENAMQRLERSFVQQRTFVSDAAHELKTAVAVVKSSLQLVALKPRTTAEYQTGLERCLTDTARLEDLVSKMLTLARVESGTAAAASPGSCDLADCVRQTVADLETVALQREVQVNVSAATGSEFTVQISAGDGSLLVSNLLLNALQHSPSGTSVAIRLSHTDGAVELAIEDHGEGIDPAALPHVFDRFYRGDPSRARATGGAGLGLAICKGIVEKACGSVQLASQPVQGTTVRVLLPSA
jgi:signal transduction histidine kinase